MKRYFQLVLLFAAACFIFGFAGPLLVSYANTEEVIGGFVMVAVSIPVLLLLIKKVLFPGGEKKDEKN
jgi:hypothetical protein